MSCPIPYEKFAEYIRFVQRESEFNNKLHDLYREYEDVVPDADAPLPVAGEKIVELLENAMEIPLDDISGSTLRWWLFDCNFGKDKDLLRSFCITSLPKTHKYYKPKLETVRELYDFLVWEAERARDE